MNRDPPEVEKEIVALVRERVGPVAAFNLAITAPRLPKTRSGKVLRGAMKKIADGEACTCRRRSGIRKCWRRLAGR